MRILICILCLACFVCQAQEAEQIPSLVKGKAGKSRCLSDLGGGNKRCWALKSIQPLEISANSEEAKFTKVRIVEVGLQTSGGKDSSGSKDSSGGKDPFVVGVAWEGQSAGTLSFSGPKGTLFAVGSISRAADNTVFIVIDAFSDESFAQQYDRGVVFGESDPQKLRQKTLQWLNEIVVPFLENYVLNSNGRP